MAHNGTYAFYWTGKECATIYCIYTQSVYLEICRHFRIHLMMNCTILLTPKSNFFCLVYLDFSVCFIVKQPTRVVVHKTAFES
uniref:Uncharacterized protein n=1 Tax=Chelonoidis abingdonii TaxID=106734 RepID=A0A8C0IRF4_CHEAB